MSAAVLSNPDIDDRQPLWVVHYNGKGEWLEGIHAPTGPAHYFVTMLPLEGASFAYMDLVEARLRDGNLVVTRILRRSPWRIARFLNAQMQDKLFKARIDEIDGIGCICMFNREQQAGSVAYLFEHVGPLGRLMRQAEHEGVWKIADEREIPMIDYIRKTAIS
jgi:hypothetical protein